MDDSRRVAWLLDQLIALDGYYRDEQRRAAGLEYNNRQLERELTEAQKTIGVQRQQLDGRLTWDPAVEARFRALLLYLEEHAFDPGSEDSAEQLAEVRALLAELLR